jgi:hypothetical protein
MTWIHAALPDAALSKCWSDVAWPKPDTQAWYDFPYLALGRTPADWDFDDIALARQCAPRMTREQLLLLAVLNVDGQICNGGVSQMLYNSYGQLAEEAVEGYRLFGFARMADLVDEALTLFGPRPTPRERSARIARLEEISAPETDAPSTSVENLPQNIRGSPRSDPHTLEGVFEIFRATRARWEAIETEYYGIQRAETHGPGYNAAFWRPLAEWIADHRDRFFVMDA